jgi:hypothetical protein
MIAAQDDPRIAALVLDSPIEGFDGAFADRVGPDKAWVRVLRPLFKWTFEVMYHVDTDTLNPSTYAPSQVEKPVLRFASAITQGEYQPRNVAGICRFLRVHGLGDKAQIAGARD